MTVTLTAVLSSPAGCTLFMIIRATWIKDNKHPRQAFTFAERLSGAQLQPSHGCRHFIICNQPYWCQDCKARLPSVLQTQRSSFSLTRVTWIFKVTPGETKYTPAPFISGWTTHANLMQTNGGGVQVRSTGTPLASFWDRKQTNDNSPCLQERSHHLDPHTPELQPWAHAFLSIALQLSWWYKEGDYSPQGVKKGHVLKRISREHGAMNVEPSQA